MKATFIDIEGHHQTKKVSDMEIGIYANDNHQFIKVGEGKQSFIFNINHPEIVLTYDEHACMSPVKIGTKVSFTQG